MLAGRIPEIDIGGAGDVATTTRPAYKCVRGQARNTNDLTLIIKAARTANCASQATKVNHFAVLPEEWVQSWKSSDRVRRRVGVRHPSNLAVFVNKRCVGVWTTQSTQVLHRLISP